MNIIIILHKNTEKQCWFAMHSILTHLINVVPTQKIGVETITLRCPQFITGN